jgi:ABC-2 type transport system ATP-binding protein
MQDIVRRCSLDPSFILGFATESEVDSYILRNRDDVYGAYIFNTSRVVTVSERPVMVGLQYSVQFDAKKTCYRRKKCTNPALDVALPMMYALDQAAFQQQFGFRLSAQLQGFPRPRLQVSEADVSTAPFLFLTAFSLFSITCFMRIMRNKFCFGRELFRTMNVRDSSFWISTVLMESVVLIASTVVAFCFGLAAGIPMFEYNGFEIFLGLFFVYGLWSIILACVCTTLFDVRRKYSWLSTVPLHVCIIFFGLILSPAVFSKSESADAARFVGLLPSSTFAKMIKDFAQADLLKSGTTSINAATHAEVWPFYQVFSWTIFDIFLLSIVLWIADNLSLTYYGKFRSWLFWMQRSYWTSADSFQAEMDPLQTSVPDTSLLEYVEDDDVRLEREYIEKHVDSETKGRNVTGITFVNMMLRYHFNPFTAPIARPKVQQFFLQCPQGKCTCVLCPDKDALAAVFGALSGLLALCEGTILLAGLPIYTFLDISRLGFGYASSKDTLVPNLSVQSHFWLTGRLKNIPKSEATQEAEELMKTYGIWEVRSKPAGSLSSPLRRRLVLSLGLMGAPSTVFLDNPLDNLSLREREPIWAVLKQSLVDKTVVFLTTSPDEAIMFSHKLAFMIDTRLRAVGSIVHLHRKHSAGYVITINLRESGQEADIVERVLTLLPEAELIRVSRESIMFRISKSFLQHVHAVFADLETNSGRLGIRYLSCSVPTFTDVYDSMVEEIVQRAARR